MSSKTVNFRTLDLNLLRVFDVVMSEMSITKAAKQLSLTQPAVSNAIHRLRFALDNELFIRQGSSIIATPRAQALWPEIHVSLMKLEELLAPESFEPGIAQTTFILAMADATSAELMPVLSDILEHEASAVALRVVPLTTRDPRKLLEQEVADLAIGHFPSVLADLTARAQAGSAIGFSHQRLSDGEYVCVMGKHHPLANQELSLDTYCAARHMLVSFSGRPFGFVDEALASLGQKRQIVLTVNQFSTAGRVAASSNLLTVLPLHFLHVTGMLDYLIWKRLPFDVPPVHIDMLWHQQANRTAALGWLRNCVSRAANQVWPKASKNGKAASQAIAASAAVESVMTPPPRHTSPQ
jgi:DNA-binding transcriptional LysR family regulator